MLSYSSTIKLQWYGLFVYNEGNVKKFVIDKGGNYMISVSLTEGGYKPIYVGKAVKLETRLLQHLSSDEENECLRSRVSEKVLYFRYCYIDSEEDRKNIEHTLWKKHSPKCNEQEPEGKEVSITLPY